MLAHEHARVAELPRLRDQREQLGDAGVQRGDGVLAHTDAARRARGADLAVVLDQREQELVLAREAAVERLQREAGARRDLRDGERGAGGLARELAGGGDAALHALDVAGAGVGQGAVERPVLPAGRVGTGGHCRRTPFSRHYRRSTRFARGTPSGPGRPTRQAEARGGSNRRPDGGPGSNRRLTLLEGDVLALGGPGVDLAGATDLVVRVLVRFFPVREPARAGGRSRRAPGTSWWGSPSPGR